MSECGCSVIHAALAGAGPSSLRSDILDLVEKISKTGMLLWIAIFLYLIQP